MMVQDSASADRLGYIAIESGSGQSNGTPFVFGNYNGDVYDIEEENVAEIDISDLNTEEPLFIANIQDLPVWPYDDNWLYTHLKASELRFSYVPGFKGVKLASENYGTGMKGYYENKAFNDVAYLAFEGETNIYAWKNLRNPMRMEIDEEDGNCTFKGQVLGNSILGEEKGVLGALVIIKETGEWKEITNESGFFIFTGLQSKNYTVKVTRTGYEEMEINLPFPNGDEKPTRRNTRTAGSRGDTEGSTITTIIHLRDYPLEFEELKCLEPSDFFVTTIEIIEIKAERFDDICENKENKEDEVYLVVDNVRYPHPDNYADEQADINYIFEMTQHTNDIKLYNLPGGSRYLNLDYVVGTRMSPYLNQYYKLGSVPV